MSYNIIFNPTVDHLQELECWLKAEEVETNEGFYCNWHIIRNSFEKNDLVILEYHNLAIGLLVYTVSELTVKIDIAEIKPDFRGRGLGRFFVDGFLDVMAKRNILVAELYCKPLAAEPIWKKLSFLNFPKFPNESRVRMYRVLVPALKPEQHLNNSDGLIELWNDEPYLAMNQPPVWQWVIKYKPNSQELLYPIIHPASYEWQICWRTGAEIFFTNRIKRFDKVKIEYGNFIIIKELPLKN